MLKVYSFGMPEALTSVSQWRVLQGYSEPETAQCSFTRDKWMEACSVIRPKVRQEFANKASQHSKRCRKWLWVIWRRSLPVSHSAGAPAKTSPCQGWAWDSHHINSACPWFTHSHMPSETLMAKCRKCHFSIKWQNPPNLHCASKTKVAPDHTFGRQGKYMLERDITRILFK